MSSDRDRLAARTKRVALIASLAIAACSGNSQEAKTSKEAKTSQDTKASPEKKTYELATGPSEHASKLSASIVVPGNLEEEYKPHHLTFLPKGARDMDLDNLAVVLDFCPRSVEVDEADADARAKACLQAIQEKRLGNDLAAATLTSISNDRVWVRAEFADRGDHGLILEELVIPAGELYVVCTMSLMDHHDRRDAYREVCESIEVL
jgi:hypothetical protein